MVSLNIPLDVYEFVKKHGWNHREVYLLGIQAKQDNPQLLNRLSEFERGNEKLQKFATNQSQRIEELKQELAKIKGEKYV